jgi:hypothetical protein
MITLWFKVMGTQFHTSQMLMMRISLEVFIKIEAGAFQLMPFSASWDIVCFICIALFLFIDVN